MADPRVVSAMKEATHQGAIDGAVPIAQEVVREQLNILALIGDQQVAAGTR